MKKETKDRDRSMGYAPIHTLIPVELKQRLKEASLKEGIPMRQIIVEALERYLEEEERK